MIAEVLGPVLGPVVRHPSGAAAKRRRTRCAGSKNPARELSRAQRGFYIFGNAAMVTRADKLWWDIGSVLNQLLAALEVMLRFLINSGWIGAVGWRFMDGCKLLFGLLWLFIAVLTVVSSADRYHP